MSDLTSSALEGVSEGPLPPTAGVGESEGPLPPTARVGESEERILYRPLWDESDESMPPAVAINVPSNFLIVHSTMPYQRSKRNKKEGTWFLDELHLAFDSPHTPGTDVNFLELLTQTNAGVSRRESVAKKEGKLDEANSGHKFTTILSHRLCTDLVFQKSTAPQDEEMPALQM